MFFPLHPVHAGNDRSMWRPTYRSGGGASDGDGTGTTVSFDRRLRTPLHPHLGLLRSSASATSGPASAGLLSFSIFERYGPSLAALINRYDALKDDPYRASPRPGLCILILHTGPLPLIRFFPLPCAFLVVYRVRRESAAGGVDSPPSPPRAAGSGRRRSVMHGNIFGS